MADKKITELNEATIPLIGNEVLPIVQNGGTVKTSIINLLSGSNLSDFNDDIGATDLEVVIVTDKSQIVNQALDASKKYAIRTDLVLTDNEYIIMDNSPLIEGLGADYTNISTTSTNGIIFRSNACGNINIKNISLSSLYTGSSVFDLVDSDGSHEFRLIGVNFIGCKSLGNVHDFRQWFSKDIGWYGCADGITMHGSWTGMYFEQANMFAITTGATFFKEGVNLTFSGRCLLQSNFDVPSGVVFMDFIPDVFLDVEALQINNTVAKVDGVKNQINANTLFPNIGANNPKSLWGINDGLPSTASELIIIDNNVSGTYEIDWLNDTYDLTLTADTTFTEVNLPASGRRTKTINITISGDYTPTFPTDWEINKVGSIKVGDLNDITIKFISTSKYSMKISNSLSVYPAPILGSLNPVSLLPNSTSELIISGSFYTPEGFVVIDGQTVNTIEFDPDTGDYILSVTTGALEGEFDITISNGTEVTFEDRMIINLGEVTIPTQIDWNTTGIVNVEDDGEVKTEVGLSDGDAVWDIPIALNVDSAIRFKVRYSPLVQNPVSNLDLGVYLTKQSDSSNYCGVLLRPAVPQFGTRFLDSNGVVNNVPNIGTFAELNDLAWTIEFRAVNNRIDVYSNNVFRLSCSNDFTEPLMLKMEVRDVDYYSIKYIELP